MESATTTASASTSPVASTTAAPSSAPAVASTGTSTPSAAETVATGSAAASSATPTTAAAPALQEPKPGESDAAFMARLIAEDSGEGTDDATGDAGADDAAALEAAAAEDKPADEKKAEEKPAEAADEDDFDPYVQQLGAIGPKDLAAKISANPALKAALDSSPELKNELFAASRLAAETASFKEVFANADEAKIAAAGNKEFSAISELVTGIDKPEDASTFYGKLMELSVLHDDEGNVLKDAQGNPRSDGTVGRLIHHTGALFLNHFEQLAETSNDSELTAAVEILKARAFGGPASTDNEDFTEEQKAKAAELDTREKQFNEREQATQAKAKAEYEQGIATGIDTIADTQINSLIGRTDIPEKDRGALAEKIRKAAYDLAVENPQFQREQDALMRRIAGPKTREERIALGKKWLGIALPIVGPKLIAEAGNKILAKQNQRTATQAAREEASRSEAAGTLHTSRPLNANPQQVTDDVTTKLAAKLGRAPKSDEILAALMSA